MAYGNQKQIEVVKSKCDKENYYMMCNLNALELAAADLSAGAFKLYIYFVKNQNGYIFDLSSKDIKDKWGMGKTQYDNAVKELINKGFLLETEKNKFIFTDKPRSAPLALEKYLDSEEWQEKKKQLDREKYT